MFEPVLSIGDEAWEPGLPALRSVGNVEPEADERRFRKEIILLTINNSKTRFWVFARLQLRIVEHRSIEISFCDMFEPVLSIGDETHTQVALIPMGQNAGYWNLDCLPAPEPANIFEPVLSISDETRMQPVLSIGDETHTARSRDGRASDQRSTFNRESATTTSAYCDTLPAMSGLLRHTARLRAGRASDQRSTFRESTVFLRVCVVHWRRDTHRPLQSRPSLGPAQPMEIETRSFQMQINLSQIIV
jgi:hypothetical protein